MQRPRPTAKFLLTLAAATGLTGAASERVAAAPYLQTNLVSSVPGLAAITDPALINPWGVAESPTGPFWVSDQGANASTLYSVSGSTNVAKVNINPPSGLVAIPTTAAGPQGLTGQVSITSTSSFLVGNGGNGGSAHFVFDNLNGTISAWDTGASSFVQAKTPGAVYTGLAVNSAQTQLYAANVAGGGGINVFNGSFAPVTLQGNFTDANLPTGLVPFDVEDIGGKVYVTYAPAAPAAQDAATAGTGVVDVYDENGNFLQRLITGGQLAAPWGLALAPASFGIFGGDLLVGNFSFVDSGINAYNATTGAFLGSIPIDVGSNSPGGLWSLNFGNGGTGGSPNTLYVADGINGETGGLFAAITPVPEPSSLALLSAGLGFIAIKRRRAGVTRIL